MKRQKDARALAAIYPSLFDVSNFRSLDRFEIYDRIRRGEYKAATDAILHQFGEAMRAGTHKGEAYSNAKKRLQVCTFSTRHSRDTKIPLPDDFRHPGVICIDVDTDEINTSEAVKQARAEVEKNTAYHFEAVASSISGAVTGAFWVNVKIDVPQSLDEVLQNTRLCNLLNIDTENESLPSAIEKIHKAYFKLIEHFFLKDFGVQIDTKAQDVKRARFLSDDPNIKIWSHCVPVGLDELIRFLEREQGGQPKQRQYTGSTASSNDVEGIIQQIEEFGLSVGDDYNDWYKIGFAFANQFGEAGRPLFHRISRTSGKYSQRETDAKFDHLLRTSKGKIGIGRFYHIAKKQGADTTHPQLLQNSALEYHLKPGERVSDIAHVLAEVILDKKKVCIKAGTGSGKSYAAANVKDKAGNLMLPGLLRRGNGAPTVLVLSLNVKAQKDGHQYGVPVWTGESMRNAGLTKHELRARCLASDVVCTSHNYAPRVLKAFEQRGTRANLIIDESHSLIIGAKKDYKPQVMFDLWEAANQHAATVTVMSGTPSDFFLLNGFQRINITNERPAIKAHFRHRVKGDLPIQAVAHITQTDTSARRVVVKIESKKALQYTKRILISRFGFKDDEVLILSADPHRKESKEFKYFVAAVEGKESFLPGVKVILTTSVIGEGLDVYSDKPIDFVCIEKRKTVDVTKLVQFADRHRTSSEKNLFVYTKEPDPADSASEASQPKAKPGTSEPRQANFQSIYTRAREYWQGKADFLNGEKCSKWFDDHAATDGAVFNLRTTIQDAGTFLIQDDTAKQMRVNTLAIAAAAQEIVTYTTLPQHAIKEIEHLYPYIKCIDERQSAKEVQSDEGLAGLKKEAEQARKAVEQRIYNLFTQAREPFFLAIIQRTQDAKLRQKIKEYLPKAIPADVKEAALRIGQDNSDIFTDYLGTCEKVARRFFSCSGLLLDEAEMEKVLFKKDQNTGADILQTAEKFSIFMNSLKIHLLCYLFGLSLSKAKVRGLTSLQLVEAFEVNSIKQAIKKAAAPGLPMDSKELAKVINQRRKAGSKKGASENGAPFITAYQAVRIAGTLFELKRSDDVYHIGKEKTLADVFFEYEISEENYLKKVYNLLKIKDVFGINVHNNNSSYVHSEKCVDETG